MSVVCQDLEVRNWLVQSLLRRYDANCQSLDPLTGSRASSIERLSTSASVADPIACRGGDTLVTADSRPGDAPVTPDRHVGREFVERPCGLVRPQRRRYRLEGWVEARAAEALSRVVRAKRQ
jgi:hypothetical protein